MCSLLNGRSIKFRYRLLDDAFLILKSLICLPDLSSATSQRGCLPRPDQVSEGWFGLRNFGKTGG